MATIQGHGPERGARRGAIDGGNVWWVAPTYGVAAKIWRDLKLACGRAWRDKSEVERRIVLPSGGAITVKSADRPDSLRGDGLDGLVIDEAAFVTPEVWRDVLRPALSDRQGWAVFISSPNGRNWFYDLFQLAGRDGATWWRWQRPTGDNPIIRPEELEAAREEVGLRSYSQEYLAQFVDQAGAEFAGEYFGEGAWFREWPAADQVRWRVIAVDPSKGKTDKSDYSAIVRLALAWDGTLYVAGDLERRDARKIVDDTIRAAAEFRPDAVGFEANQFQEVLVDLVVERTKAAGLMLPVHGITSTEAKRTRIRATLTPYLARGEIRFLSGDRGTKLLVEQLQAFPVADYDDGPDALEMAVTLARHLFFDGAT
jgi:predicted phage terminase large subunit-like protein